MISNSTLETLIPCNHEEADTRIFIHVKSAIESGFSDVTVHTVDSDVLCLAVSVCPHLPGLKQLWVAFGTGKTYKLLPAHEMSTILGPERSQALPMFHAFTGCDTVSAFAHKGKKTCWSVWNTFNELTETLLQISDSSSAVDQTALDTIERFVILMYD